MFYFLILVQCVFVNIWNNSKILFLSILLHYFYSEYFVSHFQNLPLYDAMFTALVQDRVDFVHLFMENGVSLKKFLSIETLWNLYANVRTALNLLYI